MNKRPESNEAAALRPLRREERLAPEDIRMAELFRKDPPLDPISEIAAVRIRRKLDRRISELARSRYPAWLQRSVVAAASMFVLQVAAAAAISASPVLRQQLVGVLAARLAGAHAQPAVQAPPASVATVEAATRPAATPPAPAPPPGAPLPGAPLPGALLPGAPLPGGPLSLPQDQQRHPRRGGAAPHSSGVEDADAALYSLALSQLNIQHDPASALSTLEIYRREYPNGLFRAEAAVAEIRANLMQGLDGEALILLDAMHARSFDGIPQAFELGLVRAELLGQAERCKEVLPLLDTYLSPSLPPEQRERALFLRASCRAQLKDFEGSRRDLDDYLREFPQGRFASKARHAMGALP
jgi:Tetratricopeptide repeat